jgi:murein DD-endopeptidase MepM/ murein hydrolase activator NlpD
MAKRKTLLLVFLCACALLALSACLPLDADVHVTPQPTATPTSTAQDLEPIAVQPEEPPLVTPQPTPQMIDEVPSIMESLDCGEPFCQVAWSGWLERPLKFGARRTIDRSYPYGSTGGGEYDLHHGVEFLNSFGTPVLAAQDGVVVFADMDDTTLVGPFHLFYGNVVVLRHTGLLPDGQDVYTLYAHLSEIEVAVGDAVVAGEVIGKVGATGAAFGSHLHFETRVGSNDYDHTTNPVLWFAPLDDADHQDKTMLAGLILDRNGNPLPEFPLVLEKLSDSGAIEAYYYPQTYYGRSVNGHPKLGENFAVPDIPAGNYRLAFIYERMYAFTFTLEAGSLGFIKVQVD